MNKELIKKYKTEFDHWLNDGEVLFFTWKWYSSKHNPNTTFNHSEPKKIKHYIINDEYVEFRKAIAEGKTIQFHYINPTLGLDEWQTINDINSLTFSHSIDLYRIKPEKPQFKIGDWVETFGGPKLIKTNQDIEKFVSKKMTVEFSLWKPQPSEWCWSTVFGLVKVICKTTEVGKPCYLCWNPWQEVEQKLNSLEPFIGELPTHLKD